MIQYSLHSEDTAHRPSEEYPRHDADHEGYAALIMCRSSALIEISQTGFDLDLGLE